MTTQTQSNPAQAPDAQPVTAVDPNTARLLAERDGYRQALETEKMLRAADVRELRAALDEMLACHELRAHKGETFTPLQIKAADAARAALARGTK